MSLANIYAPVIPSERRLFFNSFPGSLHTNEVRLFFSDGIAFPCRLQPSKCRPDASFFFGVRIMLGTILGRFSIIYFRRLGLSIKVMVWVMVRVRVGVWVGVRVSVVLWSW